MAYDSSGNHNLTPGYKAVAGQKVLPSNHNPPLEDISASLGLVYVKDGRAPMTGPMNMNGNKIVGIAEGIDPSDAATVGQAAAGIGDFKESIRDLGDNWLRRDGALYDVADYPDLAAELPSLPDGILWGIDSFGSSINGPILAKPGGGFLVGRRSSNNTDIFSSTDGQTWNLVTTILSFDIYDLAFGGGVYLAADGNGKVATSSDGINWGSTTSSIAGFTSFVSSVAYGAGLFVACVGVPAGADYLYSSPDGIVWTQRYTSPGNYQFERIRFVNGTFVAVGMNGTIATSTNGTTWTARTPGTTQTLYGAAYGNGLYVVAGANGVILTSPNLTTWTSRSSGTTQQFNAVLFSSAGFLAVGNAGTARISGASDGTIWAASATGSSINLFNAAADALVPNRYAVLQSNSPIVLRGIRTLPTQFQVPDDDPDYGWIRAV